jgi:hypothetical protein
MGMDLTNKAGGTERFSNASWREILMLAYEYGWKPAGTEAGAWIDPETGELNKQLSPDPDEWDGDYFSNSFQWVTEEDAASIADALERALKDKAERDTDSSPEYFSGEGKQKIRAFIAFCRVGEFFIA